jgi:predicted membrane protein
VIGPINNFFVAHPLVFRIIFREPYSFSLTFLLVLIMWVLVAWNIKKIVSATNLVFEQKWAAWLVGILFTIILAQSNLYTAIANFILNLILAKENFWIRFALWVAVCFGIILIYYFGNIISKQLKASKEAREKAATKQAGKVVQQTSEGITKGE